MKFNKLNSVFVRLFLLVIGYWAILTFFFVLNTGIVGISEKIADIFFVLGFLALLNSWMLVFPPGIPWVLIKAKFSTLIFAVVLMTLIWSFILGNIENYVVKPGYFGRAIDNGEPTVHYYIDSFVNVMGALIVGEMLRRVVNRLFGLTI